MKWKLWLAFLRDLIHILPQESRLDWQEVDSLAPGRPTVILISGFAATARALSIMRKRLQRDGFNVLVLSLDWHTLSDGFRGLYSLAERLSSLALKLRKDRNSPKVYLIAHSAGGLVARYYVQLLGGNHYCDGLITLGTPHRGSWVAALGLFSPLILKAGCLIHMLPHSRFIWRINSAPLAKDFWMVSIHSRGDFLCYSRSARLPVHLHIGENVKSVHIPNLSHSDLLFSKRAYRVLRKYLIHEGKSGKRPKAA